MNRNVETVSSLRTRIDGGLVSLDEGGGAFEWLKIRFASRLLVLLTSSSVSPFNDNKHQPRKGVAPPALAASAPATPSTSGRAFGESSGGSPPSGKVLLLSFEEPGDGGDASSSSLPLVTIEALQVMLSRYGPLHKATLFDGGAGLQALVQFSDASSACAALRDLGAGDGGGAAGRPFPSFALPVANPPWVRAQPSRHADLCVRFQSHRSRDFLDPSLPFGRAGTGGGGGGAVAALATAGAATATATPAAGPTRARRQATPPPAPEGAAEKEAPTSGNVLLVAPERADGCDEGPLSGLDHFTPSSLGKLFSPCGRGVARVSVFRRKGEPRALVQMRDEESARAALESLDGRRVGELSGQGREGAETEGEQHDVVMRLSYSVHSEVRVPEGAGPEKAIDFGSSDGDAAAPSSSPAPLPRSDVVEAAEAAARHAEEAAAVAAAAAKAAAAAAARLRPSTASTTSARATRTRATAETAARPSPLSARNANRKRPATAPAVRSLPSRGSGGGSGSGSGASEWREQRRDERPASAALVVRRRSSGGVGSPWQQQLPQQPPPEQQPQWDGGGAGFAPPQRQQHGGFFYAQPPPPPPSAFFSSPVPPPPQQQQQPYQHPSGPPPSWPPPPPWS